MRAVVRQVTINPNTVQRAYRELEHLGLAEGRLGLGTFIVDATDTTHRQYQTRSWRDELSNGVELARSSGVEEEEIVGTVRSLLSNDFKALS